MCRRQRNSSGVRAMAIDQATNRASQAAGQEAVVAVSKAKVENKAKGRVKVRKVAKGVQMPAIPAVNAVQTGDQRVLHR